MGGIDCRQGSDRLQAGEGYIAGRGGIDCRQGRDRLQAGEG